MAVSGTPFRLDGDQYDYGVEESEVMPTFVLPRLWSFFLPIALLGTQAPAPQAATQSNDNIVVTGQTRDAARERAQAFIRATGVAAGDGRYKRHAGPRGHEGPDLLSYPHTAWPRVVPT